MTRDRHAPRRRAPVTVHNVRSGRIGLQTSVTHDDARRNTISNNVTVLSHLYPVRFNSNPQLYVLGTKHQHSLPWVIAARNLKHFVFTYLLQWKPHVYWNTCVYQWRSQGWAI